ncbi:integral ER membrane protein Scs2, putative [Talaromyces stipitatus ATCC 10500]|uniref:Integral ER membrane protein Scs2, putative n=1 Tax=Talaromyces stipitatus (strain ATCC 10500 / CBS 375.48 / QM 6759 / NRRL 1006) TaxID=441959 RepID=B8LUH9_TALSN|nr:integral ER membrane protein Scs2, putative [Talaromyces stipitatus ATCC 10500]EED23752.1 integral ER membrane protein Scs2, putative [Talaromyces stipitatus ATCC 10500]
MSVDLEPGDLGFRRPFNREVSEVLHIRNPQSDPIAFKVKTTAPKHYCVRPNSGRIEPGKQVEVQVLLQAMKEDPPLDAKCKDKFLVQSVAITGDLEFANVTSIFEKAPKAAIQERRIRVAYLPADIPDGSAQTEEEPPAYSSPGGAFETPAPTASRKIDDSTSPIPAPNFEKSPKPETTETSKEADLSAFENAPSTAAAATTEAKPDSSDNIKEQLSDALAQIQKLKAQLTEQGQGLRQRRSDGSEPSSISKAGNMIQQQIAQPTAEMGVPVQIVAALCLLSFLLAYFFF